ncbi:NifB/NifX family molybdenum-iron cluster-binding protein [bacterium]|nr:NifB/NifX family molybdenum-iron cluster-binding protein [bacterium]
MKVALSSTGNTLDSQLDQRFGRAAYFLIVDTVSDSISVIDNNENVQASHGAGLQSAQNVVNSGATVVITGNVGPKALSVMQRAKIDLRTGASGTCRECLQAFKAGSL